MTGVPEAWCQRCFSISASSSASNDRFAVAATLSSSCFTLEAPISAEVTLRSTQAIASWANVCPRRFATSFNARTLASVDSSRLDDDRNGEAPAAREPSGTPSR